MRRLWNDQLTARRLVAAVFLCQHYRAAGTNKQASSLCHLRAHRSLSRRQCRHVGSLSTFSTLRTVQCVPCTLIIPSHSPPGHGTARTRQSSLSALIQHSHHTIAALPRFGNPKSGLTGSGVCTYASGSKPKVSIQTISLSSRASVLDPAVTLHSHSAIHSLTP